ncbi:MAG TPA: hypothetical protein VLI39_14280 [Sedimentisphaerales bacterium]|nr:hypothetical protein [Sedimentisphaerales bacterium]
MARLKKVDRAISALLTSPSVADAASKSGVSLRTLFRWLRDDDFRQELREVRQQAFDSALSRASYASNEAVDVLLKAMRGESITRIQLWAARGILDVAETVREDDVLSRLERLERAVRERKERNE